MICARPGCPHVSPFRFFCAGTISWHSSISCLPRFLTLFAYSLPFPQLLRVGGPRRSMAELSVAVCCDFGDRLCSTRTDRFIADTMVCQQKTKDQTSPKRVQTSNIPKHSKAGLLRAVYFSCDMLPAQKPSPRSGISSCVGAWSRTPRGTTRRSLSGK